MQPQIVMTLISSNVFEVHLKTSRNHFISKKYNALKSFRQHYPQYSPLHKYTFLPTAVKMLEAFLETIL
jgi:hypothetical protein